MNAFAKLFSAELEGIQARIIEVEVDLNVGLHAFNIVGLADKALNEARERVNSALKNSGAKPPNRENRKITVNLAPANIRKTGSQYDLAIALGYLITTKQICKFDTRDKIFLGELSLDGRLRPIGGALCIAETALSAGFRAIFLPRANANEASAVSGLKIIPADSLPDVVAMVENRKQIVHHIFREQNELAKNYPDFSEIRGQEGAKRAITIAASGNHNLLMIGPPGVGKSLLAKASAGILPRLTKEESVELTKIWSSAKLSLPGLIRNRPFRAPHPSSSLTAFMGGGQDPKPGEISLAHRGILFMDELAEFPRNILEALRGPMESRIANIARAKTSVVFPASFCLIAAMNPCPCGFYGDPGNKCVCSANEILRYQKKISGPLLDRIDLQIRLSRVPLEKLRRADKNLIEESNAIRNLTGKAHKIQLERFSRIGSRSRTNSDMSSREIEIVANLSTAAEKFLKTLRDTTMSPRGYYRLLKTARTIADLDSREKITDGDLAEAWSYRLRENR